MRLDRSHPSSSSDIAWTMQAATPLFESKCSLLLQYEVVDITSWRFFFRVSICLWWRENMKNVVYSYFHVDHFFLQPLLHVYCIFKEYFDKEEELLHYKQPQQLNLLCWVETVLLSMLGLLGFFPVYSAKSVIRTSLCLTVIFFLESLNILYGIVCEKSPAVVNVNQTWNTLDNQCIS